MPVYIDDRENQFFAMGFDLCEDGYQSDHFHDRQYSGRGIFRVRDGMQGLLLLGPWLSLGIGLAAAIAVGMFSRPAMALPSAFLTFLGIVGIGPGLLITLCSQVQRVDRRIRFADPQPRGMLWFPIFQGLAMIPGAWGLYRLVLPYLPRGEAMWLLGLQGFSVGVAVLGIILIVQQVAGIIRLEEAMLSQR